VAQVRVDRANCDAHTETNRPNLNRNFETTKLQYKHFIFDLQSDNGFKIPYWLVRLVDRKGWQKHANDGREGLLQGKVHNWK
jgi:hypothetical protein